MESVTPITANTQVGLKSGGSIFKAKNCLEALAGIVGLGACTVLMGIHMATGNTDECSCQSNKVKCKKRPKTAMGSPGFALFNITLGLTLVVIFYSAIFKGLMASLEILKVPLKAMIGGVVVGLFFLSARIITNWKEIKDKKWYVVWEYWVALVGSSALVLTAPPMLYYTKGKICLGI